MKGFSVFAILAVVCLSVAGVASEPTIQWERQSKKLQISADEIGRPISFEIEIPQTMRWEERVEKVVNENKLVEVEGYCDGLDCPDSGNGKSPAWDKFYSAPGSQKAHALAEAIKGVGDTTAAKLVQGRYFQSKPRSWRAFVAEIDRAVADKTIDSRIRYEVVVKYRNDNVENLGYAAGSCHPYTYKCMKWEYRNVPVVQATNEPRSKVLQTYSRTFNVTLSGSKLQYFESETVEIGAGLEPTDLSVNAGPFNTYSAKTTHAGNISTVDLTATKRNFVALPKGVVLGAYIVQKNGNIGLNLAIDAKFIPPAGGTDKLLARYVVEGCKVSFTGYCTFSKYKVIDQGETEINQPVNMVTFNATPGYKIKVRYALARRGSSWYDGSYGEETTTEEFKIGD